MRGLMPSSLVRGRGGRGAEDKEDKGDKGTRGITNAQCPLANYLLD